MMIEIALVKSILDIANSLFDLSSRFSTKEEKEKLGNWMLDIASLIKETADMLEKNEYPHGLCAEMKVYVDAFPAIASEHLSEGEMEEVHKLMRDSQDIERIYAELQPLTNDERNANISRLKVAAGKIAGMATLIQLQ